EVRDGKECTADLIRTHSLEVFALEKNVAASLFRQPWAVLQRCRRNLRRNSCLRQLNIACANWDEFFCSDLLSSTHQQAFSSLAPNDVGVAPVESEFI